jgi:hypothetical protein
MVGLYDNDSQQLNGVHSKCLVHRIFAGMVLIAMVWSVLPELLPRILGNEQMIPRGYQTIGPRFWQEGGIPH